MKTMLNRRCEASRLRRVFRHRDEGATQIEFILSLLTIMFTIFWTWEVVLAVYTYNVLSDAAKEGVRYAIVHGSNNCYASGPGGTTQTCTGVTAPTLCNGNTAALDSTGANVVTTVNCYAQLSLHDISGMTIPTTGTTGCNNIPISAGGTCMYPDGTNTAGSRVNVVVTYKYVPFLALPITPTLTTASQGRIVN